MNLSKSPRCAAYLKALGVKLDDASMNDYWAALCVAESFSDKALKNFGGINFHTMKGPELLARMEDFLEYPSKSVPVSSKKVKKPGSLTKTSPLAGITAAISDETIRAAMSPKGGWKRATLEKWGVPWPPPKGWRDKLVSNCDNGATG